MVHKLMEEKAREVRSWFIVGVSAIERIMSWKSLALRNRAHIAELGDDPRGHT
jgi:hypothetical protein